MAIQEVPRALIANHSGSGILSQQLGATMATAQQSGEQGLALLDRSPHCGASRVVVVGNHSLIALIGIPVNVPLVMIQGSVMVRILRLARRHGSCVGGANDTQRCSTNEDCPGGSCPTTVRRRSVDALRDGSRLRRQRSVR